MRRDPLSAELRSLIDAPSDEGARVRLAIASPYLGPEAGRAYADLDRRPPGFVIALPVSVAWAGDLADELP
jgi:hypothetical protein